MTVSAELYHYQEDDEERILEALREHPEDGISAFALCTRLGIKFQPLNQILEKLQRDGHARLVRRKNGATYWYPDDRAPPRTPAATKAPEEAPAPAAQDPAPEDGRAPCPVDGCTSRVLRRRQPAYSHLYQIHGLRGDELHAKLDDILGADRPKQVKPHSEDDRRPCPVPGCPSVLKGRHAHKSLINHLVRIHGIELQDAKLIADGKLAPPSAADMGTEPEGVSIKPTSVSITDPVDADIIPPSEVECDGCGHYNGEICMTGGPCPSEAPSVDVGPEDDGRIEALMLQDLPLPRPAPGPRDYRNTCTPIDVQHVTIRTTERPEDEPTSLARICALAVEMEALAARHGASVSVTITTERRRPEIRILVMGPAEASR